MSENLASRSAGWRFQILISLVMRAILVRDGIMGLFAAVEPRAEGSAPLSEIMIVSGRRKLESRFCVPQVEQRASMLILHGIGERLEYWEVAQRFLAEYGVASLVFDYSGYGRSDGATTPENLREDAISAFSALHRLAPDGQPPFVLGLSLGTGAAVDAAPFLKPNPSGLILCEPFTSLRDAAGAVLNLLRLPRFLVRGLARLLPDVYRTVDSAAQLEIPLLIVHSDGDELFPVEMAREIFSKAVAGRASLFVPHGFAHNDAYLSPALEYWRPILDFMKAAESPVHEARTKR